MSILSDDDNTIVSIIDNPNIYDDFVKYMEK